MDLLTKIEGYFLLFMIYSFLGWVMETISVSIQNKKFMDRGFLIGPYCPIYGFGSIVIMLLGNISENPVIVFIMSMVGCGILEYFTSWVMEVLFKARWWDYSKFKFNINGRVCLRNLIAFGILGILVKFLLTPIFANILGKLTSIQLLVISIVIEVIFIVDNIVSFVVITGFRKTTKQVNKRETEDNTEQITAAVKKLLSQKSILHRRLVNAYPKLQAIKIKIKEVQEKLEDATNDAKEAMAEKTVEIKNKIDDAKEDAKNTLNEKKEEGVRKSKIHLYLGKKHAKATFKKIRENNEKYFKKKG